MDRYEYPNQLGVLPRVLTSWRQAQFMCREQGKRLCSEDEFNFACEGPEMLPYVTGYVRDATKCNIDREYYRPNHDMRMFTYESCLEDDTCRAEFERLDQRQPIGASLSCASWAGVVDLNGNVNEWVRRPHKEPPNRSGLKGGWWGPVRNRCRPTVGFHKEFDYGYEAGFRCCKGLGPESPDPRYEAEHFNISPEQLEERKAKQAREAAKLGTAQIPKPGPARPEPEASKTPAPSVAPALKVPASSQPVAPQPAPRRETPTPAPGAAPGNTPPS